VRQGDGVMGGILVGLFVVAVLWLLSYNQTLRSNGGSAPRARPRPKPLRQRRGKKPETRCVLCDTCDPYVNGKADTTE